MLDRCMPADHSALNWCIQSVTSRTPTTKPGPNITDIPLHSLSQPQQLQKPSPHAVLQQLPKPNDTTKTTTAARESSLDAVLQQLLRPWHRSQVTDASQTPHRCLRKPAARQTQSAGVGQTVSRLGPLGLTQGLGRLLHGRHARWRLQAPT
jgi:hypothetical protein